MSNWISVEDRLPENEDYILLVDKNMLEYYGYIPCVGYYDLTDKSLFDADDTERPNATHWQPLPPPPETKP